MSLISALLFAFSVNIDALLVGMSYGLRKVRIRFFHNLIISLISFMGTLFSLYLGRRIVSLLPPALSESAGSWILLSLGVFYLMKAVCSDGASHGKSVSASLRPSETLLLGAALSLNNIGIGIGASISGIALLPTAVITLAVTFLFLLAGNRLGKTSLLRFSGRTADLISGGMLLLLGLCGNPL